MILKDLSVALLKKLLFRYHILVRQILNLFLFGMFHLFGYTMLRICFIQRASRY